MPNRERAVVIFNEDGYVVFTSPHCRIADNPDGSLAITDLTLDGPPEWVRRAEANGEIANRKLQALVDDGTYDSKGAARRAFGIAAGLPGISKSLARVIDGFAGAHPKLPNA